MRERASQGCGLDKSSLIYNTIIGYMCFFLAGHVNVHDIALIVHACGHRFRRGSRCIVSKGDQSKSAIALSADTT